MSHSDGACRQVAAAHCNIKMVSSCAAHALGTENEIATVFQDDGLALARSLMTSRRLGRWNSYTLSQ